ncbi:MAG: hypothetical protein ACYSX0_10220 [Planctomycetota bacterium]|jgi:hypothetical protein
MGIARLRRLLLLLDLLALFVLGIALTSGIPDPVGPLHFHPERLPEPRPDLSIHHVSMPLGWAERPERSEPRRPEPDAPTALGRVAGIVWAEQPGGTIRPTVVFAFKDGSKRAIALGEALEDRPHPDPLYRRAGFTAPHRYRFVGCEAHGERLEILFDVECDGSRIERFETALETVPCGSIRTTIARGVLIGVMPR